MGMIIALRCLVLVAIHHRDVRVAWHFTRYAMERRMPHVAIVVSVGHPHFANTPS